MKKLCSIFIIVVALWSLSLPTKLCAQSTLVFSGADNAVMLGAVEKILYQAYQQLDIEISVMSMPIKRSLRSSNTGGTDGELFRIAGIEREYPNLIRIDVPILITPIYLYTNAGDEFIVDGWESIPEDYILGYRRGLKYAEDAVSRHNLKNEPIEAIELQFQQLAKNRIDVVSGSDEPASKIISELELKNIVRLEPAVHRVYLYHYLHKKHADLVPKITRILSEMKAAGKMQ